jgi:hypothetical protein
MQNSVIILPQTLFLKSWDELEGAFYLTERTKLKTHCIYSLFYCTIPTIAI